MSDGVVDGLLVVDKPQGLTSHGVIARIRKLAGTRRVGHAGTLDPMATGVLIVGIGRATRLLGHLALNDKDYLATIRLGTTTSTDDAEGDVVAEVDPSHVTDDALHAAIAELRGEIDQVPSSVSAIKVGGVPAYKKVRSGETVELKPRPVTVSRFEVVARRAADVEVAVTCSSGTYVRALARDIGVALGVGAHLTALRRTRSGSFGIAGARTLEQLAETLTVLPLSDAVAQSFPRADVDAETRQRLIYGQPIELAGVDERPVGVFGPDGEAIALVASVGGRARSLVVFNSTGN